MGRPNAFNAQFDGDHDDTDPDGYRCAEAPFGKAVGASELAVRLFLIPPGQALCPYHYEYVEEWLMVIAGEVKVRTPTGTEPAQAGDLARFAAGPNGAHKVFNDSEEPARIVMFSADTVPSVAVYPDSDKVGVWTGNQQDKWMFRGAVGHLEYYDGDLPAEH